jgi:predicted regulator of Ras-like GTPase activity (Roadblock/LC7/MglB family)
MPPEEISMDFRAVLYDLVNRVPGTMGAILADWEGEAVERVARMDDYELRVTGAHQGVILDHLRGAVARIGADRLQEIVITTDRSLTVVLPVTEEYFLVVFLDRAATLGRALFEARRCLARLLPEIA